MSETITGDTSNTETDQGQSELETRIAAAANEAADTTAGTGTETVEAKSDDKPDETAKPAKTDWRDRRIAEQAAKIKAVRGETAAALAAKDAEIERLRAANPNAPAPTTGPEFDAAVEERLAIKQFNDACNATARAGREAFPDFAERMSALGQIKDNDDVASVVRYNGLLQAAIDTGSGHAVLHALAADLDRASEVLAMSPTRQAVELTRLADGLKAPKKAVAAVSTAPKPAVPIDGSRGRNHADTDPTDPERSGALIAQGGAEAWMTRRMAQVDGRSARR